MKKIIRIVMALFLLAQVSHCAFAAEKKSIMERLRGLIHRQEAPKPEEPKRPPAPAKKKTEAFVKKIDEMTKEELIKDMTENLKEEESLVGLVPGLKAADDGSYTYNGAKLRELDRESLESIYGRTATQLARIRNERIQRQVERIQRPNAMSVRPAPQLPPLSVNTPREVPRAPAKPPALPAAPSKIPSPPPAPQRR